jgi:hypothetical protein
MKERTPEDQEVYGKLIFRWMLMKCHGRARFGFLCYMTVIAGGLL